MAEVLIAFDEPITTGDGARYRARACGRPNAGGLWEGWLEFEPVMDGPTIPTPRETLQPNRADLLYWATGLTATYREGALVRARRAAEAAAAPAPDLPPSAPATEPARPAAPRPRRRTD